MSTYRTGNCWGVTIVAEGATHPGYAPCRACESGAEKGHDCHPLDHDRLVAVVVNGDQALAERICALLNASHQAAHTHRLSPVRALLARLDDRTAVGQGSASLSPQADETGSGVDRDRADALSVAEGPACAALEPLEPSVHPAELMPYRCTEPHGHRGPHRASINGRAEVTWDGD